MKIFTIVLFAVMIVAQWFVPMSMVYDTESTRMQGTLFRFETRPVDPTDPFRGKYITLDFIITEYETKSNNWKDDMEVYVTVTSNDDGVARIHEVSPSQPLNTPNYFKAKVYGSNPDKVFLRFPFERFYLEETKAAETETLYNQNNRDEKRKPAYAEVYVLNGNVYLHDVKIGGKSVVEMVKEARGE